MRHFGIIATFLILTVGGAALTQTPAQDCRDYQDFMHELRETSFDLNFSFHIHDAQVVGDRLYLLNLYEGVHLVDVSDAANPVLRPEYAAHDALVAGMDCRDDGLVLAVGEAGLAIFDYTDPALPVRLALVPLVGQPYSVKAYQDRAYVTRTDHEAQAEVLDVFDISDPGHPVLVNTLEGVASFLQAIEGARLYALDHEVEVYDLADPDAPLLLGRWEPTDPMYLFHEMVVRDSIAYFAAEPPQLVVADLSDPASPRVLSTWESGLFGDGYSLDMVDQTILLADDYHHFFTLDVSDTGEPRELGRLLGAGYYSRVRAGRGVAFLAGTQDWLEVVDLQSLTTFQGHHWYDFEGTIDQAEGFDDGGLCLLHAGGSVHALDCSRPEEARMVSEIGVNEPLSDMVTCGSLALFCSDQGGVQVFDYADPETPQYLGLVEGARWIRSMVRVGGLVCCVDSFGVLKILDASGPGLPTVLSSTDTDIGSGWAIAALGTQVYVASTQRIQAFDVSDPAAPVAGALLTDWDGWSEWGVGLEAHDGRLYRYTGSSVFVIEVTAAGLQNLGWVYYPAMDLELADGLAYGAAWSSGGLSVSRLGGPGFLEGVGSVQHADEQCRTVALCGDQVVAAGGDGFFITPRQCVTPLSVQIGPEDNPPAVSGQTLRSYPNPFNPRTTLSLTVARAQHVNLVVFDVRGRLVARLLDEDVPAGTHLVTWEGRDVQGRALPSGEYVARLVGDEGVSSTKVLLLR